MCVCVCVCVCVFCLCYCNNKIKHDEFSITRVTVLEARKCNFMMENNKSIDLDVIIPLLLKLSIPYAVESVAYISNLSVASNTLPTVLKTAKVVPLPKSKVLIEPNNYSSRSILPPLSKPTYIGHIFINIYLNILKLITLRKFMSTDSLSLLLMMNSTGSRTFLMYVRCSVPVSSVQTLFLCMPTVRVRKRCSVPMISV